MVDAKDVGFVEDPKQKSVQLARRRQVMTERLFDDDPRASSAIRFRQMPHNGFEQNRRDSQVMRWSLRVLERLAQRRQSIPTGRSIFQNLQDRFHHVSPGCLSREREVDQDPIQLWLRRRRARSGALASPLLAARGKSFYR